MLDSRVVLYQSLCQLPRIGGSGLLKLVSRFEKVGNNVHEHTVSSTNWRRVCSGRTHLMGREQLRPCFSLRKTQAIGGTVGCSQQLLPAQQIQHESF